MMILKLIIITLALLTLSECNSYYPTSFRTNINGVSGFFDYSCDAEIARDLVAVSHLHIPSSHGNAKTGSSYFCSQELKFVQGLGRNWLNFNVTEFTKNGFSNTTVGISVIGINIYTILLL
eukprot:TRINITY_DN5277_c0_g1_i3.p1 TRINITY_DN5277_c0_g1~~TRINITY_DN5277_c0_g1_i3.p1  ORF type:complete len:121 (+),score=12.21 TRINITY_DN5277_c0_g1_i3:72-434(+)